MDIGKPQKVHTQVEYPNKKPLEKPAAEPVKKKEPVLV